MEKENRFEVLGYSIDYYIGTKFIGSKRLDEPDRPECGYRGRQRYQTTEDILLDNRKFIRVGTDIVTELNQINGKVLNRPAYLNKKDKDVS